MVLQSADLAEAIDRRHFPHAAPWIGLPKAPMCLGEIDMSKRDDWSCWI
jgi:hypothetical protein